MSSTSAEDCASSIKLRQCDNCGTTSSSKEDTGLGICSNCKFAAYCSKECQRADWASHKDVCKLTASTMGGTSTQRVAAGRHPANALTRHLRRFCSKHATVIAWAAYQALDLEHAPQNLRIKSLLLEVVFNPLLASRFALVGTHLVPRTYLAQHADQLIVDEVQRREEKSLEAGGMGCVIILVQCGSIAEVMPVEVDEPMTDWQVREDWEEILMWRVRAGLGNFVPPSTNKHDLM